MKNVARWIVAQEEIQKRFTQHANRKMKQWRRTDINSATNVGTRFL